MTNYSHQYPAPAVSLQGVKFIVIDIYRMPFFGQDKFRVALPNGSEAVIARTMLDDNASHLG